VTDPVYFATAADWRAWLAVNSADARELWVGYHKAKSGKAGMTWAESVDAALCYGWIDGVRKRVDEHRYKIRFSPRKPTSIWSAVNIERVEQLRAQGLMQPAGLAAFERRRENRSGIYSYEQRPTELPPPFAVMLRGERGASEYFSKQPASYRRAAIWWVVSARQEATRLRRATQLIRDSASGKRIKQFAVTSRPG
jgi:uncharacterized protein YdeI (YjbR/CyaY-like superfamily)